VGVEKNIPKYNNYRRAMEQINAVMTFNIEDNV
jgi:hypothetical protein